MIKKILLLSLQVSMMQSLYKYQPINVNFVFVNKSQDENRALLSEIQVDFQKLVRNNQGQSLGTFIYKATCNDRFSGNWNIDFNQVAEMFNNEIFFQNHVKNKILMKPLPQKFQGKFRNFQEFNEYLNEDKRSFISINAQIFNTDFSSLDQGQQMQKLFLNLKEIIKNNNQVEEQKVLVCKKEESQNLSLDFKTYEEFQNQYKEFYQFQILSDEIADIEERQIIDQLPISQSLNIKQKEEISNLNTVSIDTKNTVSVNTQRTNEKPTKQNDEVEIKNLQINRINSLEVKGTMRSQQQKQDSQIVNTNLPVVQNKPLTQQENKKTQMTNISPQEVRNDSIPNPTEVKKKKLPQYKFKNTSSQNLQQRQTQLENGNNSLQRSPQQKNSSNEGTFRILL